MTNKILLKFAKKGINLSPEAYKKVLEAENPLDFTSSLIVKLKGGNFKSKDLVSVSGQTVDEIMRNSTIEKSTTRPQLTQKETKKPTVEPKPKETTPGLLINSTLSSSYKAFAYSSGTAG